MKFYRVDAECNGSPYFSTLDEAKREARHEAATSYDDIDVIAIDVGVEKENILRLLNVAGGTDARIGLVYTAKAKLKRGN